MKKVLVNITLYFCFNLNVNRWWIYDSADDTTDVYSREHRLVSSICRSALNSLCVQLQWIKNHLLASCGDRHTWDTLIYMQKKPYIHENEINKI